MKVLYMIGAIVLLIVAAGGGFYGGIVYAQSQTQSTSSDFTRQRTTGDTANRQAAAGPCGFQRTFTGNAGNGGNRQGGSTGTGQSGQGGSTGTGQSGQGGQNAFQQLGQCVARGQVKSINGDTIEVSTPVSVVTVKVDTQTVISKTDVGSLTDLQAGDRVTVFSRDSGDSPTASAVQIQRAPSQFGQ